MGHRPRPSNHGLVLGRVLTNENSIKLGIKNKRLTAAWMPYKLRTHLVQVALMQPWLVGYRRPLFWSNWFDVVEVLPRPNEGH